MDEQSGFSKEYEDYRRRAAQEAAQRKADRDEIGAVVAVPVVGALATLRDLVIARQTDKKPRFPKWRLRVGEDLVLQMQPQPQPLFQCLAVVGRDIDAEVFNAQWSVERLPWMRFSLDAGTDATTWTFRPLGYPPYWRKRRYGRNAKAVSLMPHEQVALRRRVIAALPTLNYLNAWKMFSLGCVICGKALTDPISQARMIGPECANTSSLDAMSWRIRPPQPAPSPGAAEQPTLSL